MTAAAAAMAVTTAGPAPRASSRPTRSSRPMPSAIPPTIAARRSPSNATPRLFAPTCSGRYTDSASSGPPIAAPTMPSATPTTPEIAMVIANARRRRRRSSTRAHASAPTERGDHERDRGDHDARLAESGELLLDHAVRRLRHTRLHQLCPVVVRESREPAVECLAVDARLVAHEHLRHRRLAAERLDDRLRHEQHREAPRRRDHLLLALRGQQVLGGEADAHDLERGGVADAERLHRRARCHVEVVGRVLLDDGDRARRVALESRDPR